MVFQKYQKNQKNQENQKKENVRSRRKKGGAKWGLLVGALVLAAALSGCGGRGSETGTAVNSSDPEQTAPVTWEPEETGPEALGGESGETEEGAASPELIQETVQTAVSIPWIQAAGDVELEPLNPSKEGREAVEIDGDTVLDAGYQKRLYGFCKNAWTGCGLDGTEKPFEMYYGICAEAEGSTLRYQAYSHLDDVEPTEIQLSRDGGGWKKLTVSDELAELRLDQQANDLYTLSVTFSNGEKSSLTLYVNQGELWFARQSEMPERLVRSSILEGEKALQQLAASYGVTPENASGATSKDIAYPTYAGRADSRCDTDLWRALAHQIVPDESVSDTVKLTLLHDWMTENLAYDRYVSDVIDVSRANYTKIHDGSQSVYELKTGVCRDFTNILAIMARELGIPCSSLEDDGHTWSIVYVDGVWREIDMTEDIQRKVEGKDASQVQNAGSTVCYRAFMEVRSPQALGNVISAGHGVYSDQFARTGIF